MGLKEDLEDECDTIFRGAWNIRDGTTVPEPEDVALGNEGVALKAVVLYADLVESTALVDSRDRTFAAEVYKAYLHCASKIIQADDGAITAFDGDRVMGIFIGDYKHTTAMLCALKINYAVKKIINPALKSFYTNESYVVRQVVGVDTSPLMAARTGVRGDNDLVWVGRAANYAAKLCGMKNAACSSFITPAVYKAALTNAKVYEGQDMWVECNWNGMTLYGSNWTWRIDD